MIHHDKFNTNNASKNYTYTLALGLTRGGYLLLICLMIDTGQIMTSFGLLEQKML